jgi:DNA replication protein DnaC
MEIVAGKGARRCQCRTRDAQTNLLEAARTPLCYSECSLSTYHPASNNGSQLRVFNLAYRLVREHPAIDRGLPLMRPCGVGKTHLAVAIIRCLVEHGVPCLFYEFVVLLEKIQKSYNALAEMLEIKVLAPVLEAEVLVLGKLGASKPTDWVSDTMMQIIRTRYNEKKLTIFTTNHPDTRHLPLAETLYDCIGLRQRSCLMKCARRSCLREMTIGVALTSSVAD